MHGGGLHFRPAGDAQLVADLRELTGKPVVATAQSMAQVLQQAGAHNLALVTPYLDHVNERLIAFLSHGGIRTRKLASFKAADVQALGAIRSDQVQELARSTFSADCGGLFIACSQLPTFDILDGLIRDYAPQPVCSSIFATAQAALRVRSEQARIAA